MAMHVHAIDETPRPLTAAPEGSRVVLRYLLVGGGGEGSIAVPAQVARELAADLVNAASVVDREARPRSAPR